MGIEMTTTVVNGKRHIVLYVMDYCYESRFDEINSSALCVIPHDGWKEIILQRHDTNL